MPQSARKWAFPAIIKNSQKLYKKMLTIDLAFDIINKSLVNSEHGEVSKWS